MYFNTLAPRRKVARKVPILHMRGLKDNSSKRKDDSETVVKMCSWSGDY